MEGMAFDDATGTLYAAADGEFFTVNPITGARLVTLPAPGMDVEALACSSEKGLIFGLVGGSVGTLLMYNIGHETWSPVGPTGDFVSPGLAWDPGPAVLYAVSEKYSELFGIDPDTGHTNPIGDTGINNGGGLAYVAEGDRTYTVVLDPGERVTDRDFGNRHLGAQGSIRGHLWDDLYGDNVKQPDEPYLEGEIVFLDLDRNGRLDTQKTPEPFTATDSNGEYVFDLLPDGPYVVTWANQAEWHQTLPQFGQPLTVDLAPGEDVYDANFALARSVPELIVSTLQDENDGDYGPGNLSLREAIAIAAEYPGDDAIAFDVTLLDGTITLDSSLGTLGIDSNVEIDGPGAASLTIDGGGGSLIFAIASDATATIRALTITRGFSDTYGGAVYCTGDLTIVDAVISNSDALNRGGGIYNAPTGIVTLDNVDLIGNESDYGGGAYNEGDMLVLNSTVGDNHATMKGGGVRNYTTGMLWVAESTVSGNSSGFVGGGIANLNATVDIVNSTISGNSAVENGGGLYIYQGTLAATNVTVSANIADLGDDGSGNSGGVYVYNGNVTLHNTIVAGNVAGLTSPSPDDVGGNFDATSSYNVIGVIDDSTGLDAGDAQYGTASGPLDARLGPLADNGGPTMTHALLWGSPAIEAGSDVRAGDVGLTSDQRGMARYVDADGDGVAQVDVGALESAVQVTWPLIVTTLDDAFDGVAPMSLREALLLAAFPASGGEIEFDPQLFADGRGTLLVDPALGGFEIRTALAIFGPGRERLTIDAGQGVQGFYVGSGVDALIRGLTIRDGVATMGGAVENHGDLTLMDVRLVGNAAIDPIGNAAEGGAIYNAADGMVTILDAAIDDNVAYRGGGLHNRGMATLERVIVRDNRATTEGGGIRNDTAGSVLTIRDSAIVHNGAANAGGMDLTNGYVLLVNTTVSGNQVNGNAAGVGVISADVEIVNVTIAGNYAGIGGGGLYVGGGSVQLHNSIVAANRRAGGEPDDISGGVTSASYNLIGDSASSGGLTNGANGNIVGADPLLGLLTDYGGDTYTHRLPSGSPAVDAGNSVMALVYGIHVDQRGFERYLAGGGGAVAVDMGAYECLTGDVSFDGFVGQADLDIVLEDWGNGPPTDMRSDPNGDGFVGQGDLDIVLSGWGQGTLPIPPTTAENVSALIAPAAATEVPGEPASPERSGTPHADPIREPSIFAAATQFLPMPSISAPPKVDLIAAAPTRAVAIDPPAVATQRRAGRRSRRHRARRAADFTIPDLTALDLLAGDLAVDLLDGRPFD